jgi:hypothetical protein
MIYSVRRKLQSDIDMSNNCLYHLAKTIITHITIGPKSLERRDCIHVILSITTDTTSAMLTISIFIVKIDIVSVAIQGADLPYLTC